MEIRKADYRDIDRLTDFFETGDTYHREGLPEIFRKTDKPPWTPDYIGEIISSDGAEIFVAEIDGEVLGFVQVMLLRNPEFPVFKPRTFPCVENITVDEEHRGMGVGRDLMMKAEEWGRLKGFGVLELHVWEFPGSAVDFYKDLGYRTLSRRMIKDL
jgi:ribosomal protein S18 acetylase RimI-like enzyme